MEQLLIVEDDIGLNQGLCKPLKVDDRKIISCKDLKTAKDKDKYPNMYIRVIKENLLMERNGES